MDTGGSGNRWIMTNKITRKIISVTLITAAAAAVILYCAITYLMPLIFLPSYSKASDKTIVDKQTGLRIEQKGRYLTVWHDEMMIWELPSNEPAQDFLFEDIDHDGNRELIVLCWKRGRFGKHRPTWVKRDELKWSQHIFIYKTEDGKIRPEWMASDIGMKAASWDFRDGALYITDTDGIVTGWKWNSWGLEKL